MGHELERLPATLFATLRSQLDEFLSLLQPLHSVGPERPEPIKESPVRTVSLANPDKRNRLIAQQPLVNEVFVLTDDDEGVSSRALADHRVVGGMETQIEDVSGLMALAGNPARQRGRELRINEEVHAGCRIA